MMDIEDLIYNEYEEYLIKSDKDEKTISGYIFDIIQFLEWLGLDSLDDITTDSINRYKVHMLTYNEYSPKTINRKLVAIKHFIISHELNVVVRQEKIHLQTYLDKILTSDDIDKMISMASSKKDFRAKAIFITLKMTGVRVSELIQFKVYDVNKDTVTVLGKGKKYRQVFISKRLRKVLQEYLNHRVNKSDYLFTGERGGLKRTSIHNIIKEYAELCGVNWDTAHAHSFRHYTGVTLVENGADIHEVAEILGHSSMESTRIYLKKSKEQMLEIVDKL